MGHEQAKRVGFGRAGRGLLKRLVVQGADDESECLPVIVSMSSGEHKIERRGDARTLATASTMPLTVRMRSTAPFW